MDTTVIATIGNVQSAANRLIVVIVNDVVVEGSYENRNSTTIELQDDGS